MSATTLFFDDEQVELLREILDRVPLTARYLPFVVDLLQRLPESAAAEVSVSADSSRPDPALPKGSGRGFRLVPCTDRAKTVAPEIDALLARLPHGGSL